jgi:hypothetical protein
MAEKVDVLPCDGGYPLEQFQDLPVVRRLVAVEQPRKQHGIVGNDGIGDQASALVGYRYVEVCTSDQFLFAADLRERGAQLMIGLDAVLGTMDVSLELWIAQIAQCIDAADQFVELEDLQEAWHLQRQPRGNSLLRG